jgi:hypothetical protein
VTYSVHLAGVGISLIEFQKEQLQRGERLQAGHSGRGVPDRRPVELAYIFLDGLELKLMREGPGCKVSEETTVAHLRKLQVDNQLNECLFKVLFASQNDKALDQTKDASDTESDVEVALDRAASQAKSPRGLNNSSVDSPDKGNSPQANFRTPSSRRNNPPSKFSTPTSPLNATPDASTRSVPTPPPYESQSTGRLAPTPPPFKNSSFRSPQRANSARKALLKSLQAAGRARQKSKTEGEKNESMAALEQVANAAATKARDQSKKWCAMQGLRTSVGKQSHTIRVRCVRTLAFQSILCLDYVSISVCPLLLQVISLLVRVFSLKC